MRQLYGRAWFQDHGENLLPTEATSGNLAWRKSLESMTPNEAALGWKACGNSGDTKPCTLPQFVKRVSDALRARKRPEVYKALPEGKERRLERMTSAQKYVKAMREKLK